MDSFVTWSQETQPIKGSETRKEGNQLKKFNLKELNPTEEF